MCPLVPRQLSTCWTRRPGSRGGGGGGDMNEAFIQKPEPPPPRFSEGCTDTETGSGAMNGALISHVDPVYNPF